MFRNKPTQFLQDHIGVYTEKITYSTDGCTGCTVYSLWCTVTKISVIKTSN